MKSIYSWICWAILGLTFSPTLFAQGDVLSLFEQRQYRTEEGEALYYRWMTPDSVADDQRYPLVIFLHGSGERGDDNTAQLKHVLPRFTDPLLRKKYPTFVFAPQCPNNDRWSNGSFNPDRPAYTLEDSLTQPMTLTLETLSLLVKTYPIDTTRIYVIGLSMGGAGTWEMIERFPNFFAAAVPICGYADTRYAAGAAQTPTWIFHGGDDDVVPPVFSRQMVIAMLLRGGNPIYTEFPGVKHDSWVNAFSEQPFIYDWLFAQKRR